MNTTPIPPHTCSCGQVSDTASGREATPEPGHLSLCINCGILTIFAEDMSQRPPTAEELEDIQANPVWLQIEAIQNAILERGRKADGVG